VAPVDAANTALSGATDTPQIDRSSHAVTAPPDRESIDQLVQEYRDMWAALRANPPDGQAPGDEH
jgi:pyruvate carboxylase